MLTKLPAAFFAGLKLKNLSGGEAVVSVRYNWFNKNPFGSLYFAVLSMAAEASTGILCISAIRTNKRNVSMLITKIEGNFFKKALGVISFRCEDGHKIEQVIAETLATGEGRSLICQSIGKNEAGDKVAEFLCTWSFKVRNKRI